MRSKLLLFISSFFFALACEYQRFENPVDCSVNAIVLTVDSTQNTECGKTDGYIAVSSTGGSGSYTYSINDQSPQLLGVFSQLSAGTYEIHVLDAINKCSENMSVDIANVNGLNISVKTTDSGCGTTNGTITITVEGGEQPVEYSINNGTPTQNNSFSNLPSGQHSLFVKDNADCEIMQNISIKTGVSLSATVNPIIEENCAISGCHSGAVFPNLTDTNAIIQNADNIRSRTTSRSMPLGGSLTQTQIDAIACWVDDGANNN